jgi:anaerobic magnesium-protoporphyrin IX monomethyl ester cyclase
MINITLINCSTGNYEITISKNIELGATFPPLGLLYLGKILEMNNYHVNIIDGNIEQINDLTIKKIAKETNVVGLTIYSQPIDKEFALNIAKKLQEVNPEIKLIIGGPHVSLLPKQSLKEFNADIAVCGPGEPVIVSIMESIESNRPIENLPGVYFKKNKKIVYNNHKNIIKTLDDLPFPARHLTDKYNYGSIMKTKFGKGRVTSILTSRGCPYRCRFCGLKAHIPHYQQRSVTNIIHEIDEIVSQGYTTIIFTDDNFLAAKQSIEKIMDHIITNHPGLSIWINEARADAGDKKLYEKMRKAGVKIIHYGIESGNQDILDYYNKHLSLSKIRKTINLSHKMGFLTMGSFILGAPIETKKHIKKTIDFAVSLPLDMVSFFILRYVYGSDLWFEAEKAGKINFNKNGYFIYADSSKDLGKFTKNELINFTREGYKRFYYNPSLWKRIIYRAMIKKEPQLFVIGLKFLIKNIT